MTDKFTIVTINYNNCAGLNNTIASLTDIIRDPLGISHLIVDGQSNDSSASDAAALGYIDQAPGVLTNKTILVKQDENLWEAMHVGLINAKGKYVHYINSGDTVVNPQELLGFYRYLESHDIDAAICDVGLTRRARIKRYYHNGFDAKFILNGLMPPHPGLVIKKSILTELNAFGQFDVKLPHDFWLCVKLIMRENIKYHRSNALCIHMESGGLSGRPFYSIRRIFRQQKILKLEGVRRSMLKIMVFKVIKFWNTNREKSFLA